jgi:hypothetical protein
LVIEDIFAVLSGFMLWGGLLLSLPETGMEGSILACAIKTYFPPGSRILASSALDALSQKDARVLTPFVLCSTGLYFEKSFS